MKSISLVLFVAFFSCTIGIDIYVDLKPIPRVRLLNKDKTVGCQSPKTYSPLIQLETQEEIASFISDSKYSHEFSIVLNHDLLTTSNLRNLRDSNKMAGVLVSKTPRPLEFSPASTCPNCEFGLYRNEEHHKWNPKGTNLLEEDFDFPIFLIEESEMGLIKAAVEFNIVSQFEYPLMGVEYDSFMWAVENSVTCLRRRTCDVVGGHSVWGTLKKIEENDSTKMIVVASTIDSYGLFQDVVTGRSADTSGLISALLVAEALGKTNVNQYQKNVLFGFFDAEAFGFGGSKRFVKDIKHFECKKAKGKGCTEPFQYNLDFTRVKMENIDSIIQLSQVSGLNSSDGGVLFAHVDDVSISSNLVETIISIANQSITNPSYSNEFIQPAYLPTNYKLPPSSVMSFLETKRDIPTVVITDYKTQFSNKQYFSTFDDEMNYNTERTNVLCESALVTARTVFKLANPSASQLEINSVTVNCDLGNQLMECLTLNFSCPLISKYLDPEKSLRPTHYTGIFRFGVYNSIPAFLYTILTDFIATERQGECPCEDGRLCIKDTCVFAQVNFHDAYSTAFEWDYKKLLFKIVNENEATWTESQWQKLGLRLFLIEPLGPQIGVLFAGILLTLASIILIVFIQKRLPSLLKLD